MPTQRSTTTTTSGSNNSKKGSGNDAAKNGGGGSSKKVMSAAVSSSGGSRAAAVEGGSSATPGSCCFKVVLLGEGAVGKSSILLRYTEDRFNTKHLSTIQAAFAAKTIEMDDGRSVELQIWDTAGQEKFHSLSPIYYRGSQGALLVYDITDAPSFQRVKNWIAELRLMLGENVCLLIAGNKSDLASRSRAVDAETAKSYAESVGVPYAECSAKENVGIDQLFDQLTSAMLEKFGGAGDETSFLFGGGGENNGGPLKRSPSRRSIRIVDDDAGGGGGGQNRPQRGQGKCC